MSEEAIERIDKTIKEIKEDVTEIKVAIVGDVHNEDKVGLKGHIALVKSSLNRAWWAILIIVGLLGYVLRT